MKKLYKTLLLFAGVFGSMCFQSCVSESPFDGGSDGSLSIRAEIRADITTRSENLNENTSLREKCVVYIESGKGVVRKFIGLDNLPASPISLKPGHYVAEAWTGDSVSASFSSKFYRGKDEFEINSGDNKSLLLRCNIANVVTSVNQDALELGLKNLTVTYSHSRGSLTFTEENIPTDKGYFMMPNADSDLQYKITGEKSDGSIIEKTGVIENVQRAHEYIMNITVDGEENILGGGLIRIKIEDIPIIEDTIDIYGRPTIMGEDFDIDEQIVGDRNATPGSSKAFTDKLVYIRAYEDIYAVQLRGDHNFENISHGLTEVNLLNLEEISKPDLEELGLTWEEPAERFDAVTGKKMVEMRITFKKKFFDELTPQPTEYTLSIIVRDDQQPSKSNTKVLRIATSEDAIEHKAPVETLEAPDKTSEPMAILAHSATLYGMVKDEAAGGYGIRYRKAGDSEWISVPASSSATRATNQRYSVLITGLEPATTYEYKAYEASYDDCEILTFTTEGKYVIPNASFEDWTTYTRTGLGLKNVVLPWNEGNKSTSFWGTGNEGAAMASMTLTDKSEEMRHTGIYSARLESKSAIGVLAAGNIFVGEYVKTDGTNGVLSVGRSYNGSHPTKLKVWANYRPASGVSVKQGNEQYVPANFAGGLDHSQIYIAITTEPVEIRTNPNNLKVFDPNDPVVLGYGQVTFTEAFGPDGALDAVEIPIDYNSKARTTPAKYLVIVVSASKYGDFFSGAAGSLMYLDDFELVYE